MGATETPAEWFETDGPKVLDGILVADLASAGLPSTATVDLTAAQLLELADVPVEIVPAPPVGWFIFPVAGIFSYAPGTTPLSGDANTVEAAWDGAGYGIAQTQQLHAEGTPFLAPFELSGPEGDIDPDSANGKALQITATDNFSVAGPIADSELASPGLGFAPGDTFTVDGGDGTAAGTVDTVDNAFAVSAASVDDSTFTLVGDATAFQFGDTLHVYGSPDNDGDYIVDSVGPFTAGHTIVTIAFTPVPADTAGGFAGDSTLADVGTIASYTLTNPGDGYTVSEYNLIADSPSAGANASINVTATGGDPDATARVSITYVVYPV